MTMAPLLLLLLATVPRSAEPPLARLADRFAAEIERVSGGEPVELLPPQDLTAGDRRLAADLLELTESRLRGRVPLASAGPRLIVTSALSETARELLVSARVVRAPERVLVDLIAASAELTSERLSAAAARARSEQARVEVISAGRTPPLEGPVLFLLPIDAERLLVLLPGTVELYRWGDSGLALLDRHPLSVTRRPMRAPAPDEPVWVLEAGAAEAVLLEVRGDRLAERARAAAVPWPGAASGLRYRIATPLLEGLPPPFGGGPVLTVEALPSGTLVVSADARLVLPDGTPTELRVGPSLAWLWSNVVAAPSAEPPGPRDSILIIALSPTGAAPIDSIEVAGAVRALGSLADGTQVRLVAGVDDGDESHLLLLRLAPLEVDLP
jgi:hypothetical protein